MASSSAPFKLVEIPGKGKGLVATKLIQQGELILADKPIFTVTGRIAACDLFAVIASLTPEDRSAFYQLANCYYEPEFPPFFGIYRTNAITLSATEEKDMGTSKHSGGIFPTGSRFNHSCTPNVSHYWNERVGKKNFYAVKQIPAETELTIYYTNLFEDSQTRQADLLRSFRFQCRCETCSLPGNLLIESNKRRRAIKEATEQIPNLLLNPMRALVKGKQALRNLELEGLVVIRSDLCYFVWRTCVWWSDTQNARLWAAEMAKWIRICQGSDAEEYLDAIQLIEDTTSNPHQAEYGTKILGGPCD